MADIAIELDLGTRPAKQNEKKIMFFYGRFLVSQGYLYKAAFKVGKRKQLTQKDAGL